MCDNPLAELPEEIVQLSHLELLCLQNTDITELSPEMCDALVGADGETIVVPGELCP